MVHLTIQCDYCPRKMVLLQRPRDVFEERRVVAEVPDGWALDGYTLRCWQCRSALATKPST